MDRAPLEPGGDRLRCSRCGREARLIVGTPVFGEAQEDPRLLPLAETIERRGGAEGLGAFARDHGLAPPRAGAGWQLLLPMSEADRLVSLGAAFGATAAAVGARVGQVVAVVPSPTHARILRGGLARGGGQSVDAVVAQDAATLPLPDAFATIVVLEPSAAAALGITPDRLAVVASTVARLLAPGGRLLLGLENPLHRWWPARRLRAAATARRRPLPLDLWVDEGTATPAASGPQPRRAVRRLTDVGLAVEAWYAPLPDASRAELVLPLDRPGPLRYWLHHLIRLDSAGARVAWRAARALASLGLLRLAVPYYYVTLRKPG